MVNLTCLCAKMLISSIVQCSPCVEENLKELYNYTSYRIHSKNVV